MAYGMENANAMAYTATQAQAAMNTPKRDTLQSIIENFDPLLNRLDQVVNRLSGCGDRIVGGRPQTEGVAEKNPEPNHLIWAVQARRDRLGRIVDILESETSRIEQGL